MAFNDRLAKRSYETDKEYSDRITSYIQYGSATPEEIKAFLDIGFNRLIKGEITNRDFELGIDYLRSRIPAKKLDNIIREYLEKLISPYNNKPALTLKRLEQSIIDDMKNLTYIQPTLNNLTLQNHTYSYKEIDDIPERKDYYSPEINQGEPDPMSYMFDGNDYIERARANPDPKKFGHLKRMMYKLWQFNRVMPHNQFDMDTRFSGSVHDLTSYMLGYFSRTDIDRAHTEVVQDYQTKGKRGRPPGAPNKDKVAKIEYKPMRDPILAQINEVIFDEHETIGDNTQELVPEKPVTPSTPIDLSNYVQRPELAPYAKSDNVIKYVDQVNATLKGDLITAIKSIEERQARVIEIKQLNNVIKPIGVQHKAFEELLMHAMARENVWIYGPRGTGKSVAAKAVADALGLVYYMLGALETAFQVLGYNDANGKYITTLFRECWEKGGLIAFEEIDSYYPSAALALNNALAGEWCAFPDKMVKRHPDCVIVACANTTGMGGTTEYSGRMKQDAAFLDRFNYLAWELDEVLEDAFTSNKAWLAVVRHVRYRVIAQGFKDAFISPRASVKGQKLLAIGMPIDKVMKSVLQKGMTNAQWDQVKPSYDLISACR